MAGSLDVFVYPAAELRPDLVIPPCPQSRSAGALRAMFVFGERRTTQAAAAWAVLIAARFAVVPELRGWLDLAAGVAAFYLVARLVAGRRFGAWQREFEPRWLDAQSRILGAAWFEVLRFGVQEPPDPRTGAVRLRIYDLAYGGDVARLLRRQDAEKLAGRASQVRVEFAYSRGPGRHPAVETVRLDLAKLPITASEGARRGRIRFPLARYHAAPSVVGRGSRARPGRTTFWVLGAAVLAAAAPEDTTAPSPAVSRGFESDH